MFGTLKKIFKALKGPLLNEKNPLQGEALKHVLVSSMYASQQSAFLNSYETGLDKNDRINILKNWWSITDREGALETLDYLLNSGYNELFPAVLQAYRNQEGDYAAIIQQNARSDEDYEKMVNMFRNLKVSYPQFVQDKIIATDRDLEKIGMAGWDYGRGVFIARLCWEENYISKEEMVAYLEACYTQLKRHCHSWKQYTDSYIIGRGMWNADSGNSGMVTIAQELLTHDKSPIRGGGTI